MSGRRKALKRPRLYVVQGQLRAPLYMAFNNVCTRDTGHRLKMGSSLALIPSRFVGCVRDDGLVVRTPVANLALN